MLPNRDRAEVVLPAQGDGSVVRSDLDCFNGRETAGHQELELAPVAQARDHGTVPTRIGARGERASRVKKRALERDLFLEDVLEQIRVGLQRGAGLWPEGPIRLRALRERR